MDGLSAAASVIAVIDISVKVASICFQYLNAVKDAKEDINRLQKKINVIRSILGELKQRLGGPVETRLPATHKLTSSLQECLIQLQELETQLKPSKTRKAMSRFGGGALKWPFKSKETEKIVANLEKYEQTFSLSLQIDQMSLILDLDQKFDLAKLPVARGASFNSHLEEHNSKCLANTRVETQHQILDWAKRRNGKHIFWLSGMAGTGKSTIARTIAQSFADQGRLGASFFFKKGEGDRGTASRFLTTIAVDLMTHIPEIKPRIREAVEVEPSIAEKALKDQFDQLILIPLRKTHQTTLQDKEFVIVIDALDECDREEDIGAILRLLARTREIKPISLRIFVTSRPEFPIRLGFKQMRDGKYQDLVLHEVARETIAQDITLFFENELAKIREQRSLDPSWPGERKIQTLVRMAVPLFIFAATVCRFLGEVNGDPRRRLKDILDYDIEDISEQDVTYLPILNCLFAGQPEREKEKLSQGFREIVGSIVILESPLSIISIAKLLNIPKEDVGCRLDSLHSVLSIPSDETRPIRLLHLSFRDFLVDPRKRGKTPFWVDEYKAHERLARNCLELMSSQKGLRQNICNLPSLGTHRNEVDNRIANKNLPPELRYACRYWVSHLQRSKRDIRDNDQVHKFLQNYALYWLEAMSLIGKASESINVICNLQSYSYRNGKTELSAFIQDIKRFALWIQPVLDIAPLQLYTSALIFTPEKSIARKIFYNRMLKSVYRLSNIQDDWNALLQTLEGHSDWVSSIAFSPDGTQLASGSSDKMIKLWDAATGSLHRTLEGHSDSVFSIAFSPDGTQIASGSGDMTIKIWDTATGSLQRTLEYHSGWVYSIAFSPNGTQIASGSGDKTIKLWDTATGSLQRTLEGHSDLVLSIAFSLNGAQIASGSSDNMIKLWDTATGNLQRTLEGHSDWVSSIAFSPDGTQLASGSGDKAVKLWDAVTGSLQRTLEGHSGYVSSISFSPNGTQIASGSGDNTIKFWDAVTGSLQRTLEYHSGSVSSIVFSSDGKQLASGLNDRIKLWDAATGSLQRTLEGHSGLVSSIAFSPDGTQVATGSGDKTIKFWDAATASLQRTLEGHSGWVSSIAFSPNSTQLVSGSGDNTIKLWDAVTGSLQRTLEGHSGWVSSISFSPSGTQIASGSVDNTIKLWDVATGSLQRTLEGHSDRVLSVALSPNGTQLASGSYDKTIKLWDTATGSLRWTLEDHPSWDYSIAFSPDGTRLETESEFVNLQGDETTAPSFHPKRMGRILVERDWIMRDTERILWLPSEYRAFCSDVKDDKIVLGHSSGQITLLKFDFPPSNQLL